MNLGLLLLGREEGQGVGQEEDREHEEGEGRAWELKIHLRVPLGASSWEAFRVISTFQSLEPLAALASPLLRCAKRQVGGVSLPPLHFLRFTSIVARTLIARTLIAHL